VRLAQLLLRLLAWFAADPQRIRVAVTGMLVCALVGTMLGAGIGYGLARLAGVVQALADHLAGQSRT
jgi:uncharacterized protein YcfJ